MISSTGMAPLFPPNALHFLHINSDANTDLARTRFCSSPTDGPVLKPTRFPKLSVSHFSIDGTGHIMSSCSCGQIGITTTFLFAVVFVTRRYFTICNILGVTIRSWKILLVAMRQFCNFYIFVTTQRHFSVFLKSTHLNAGHFVTGQAGWYHNQRVTQHNAVTFLQLTFY